MTPTTRNKIAAYVRLNPRATVRQIQRGCDLSSSSVVHYHLIRMHTKKTICCPMCYGSGRVNPEEIE